MSAAAIGTRVSLAPQWRGHQFIYFTNERPMFFLPLPVTGFCAAFQHGPRQTWAMRTLQRAIAEAELSRKQAAAAQGLTATQWSVQCANRPGAHASYQRLFELPRPVLKALGKALYEEFSDGGVCVEQPDLVEIVTTTRAIAETARVIDAGLSAALDARQQLRMTLPAALPEQRRA